MAGVYVHGYSAEESERLNAQAGILSDFIHAKAIFAPGSECSKPAAAWVRRLSSWRRTIRT